MVGVLVIGCLLLGFTGAAAQSTKVVEQEVRGNKHVASAVILAVTQLKPGTEYTREKAQRDRDAIIALGLFEAVLPSARTTPEGVIVVYDVVENPFIEKIQIEGNHVLSEKDILSVMQTKTGQVLNVNLLNSDSQAIRELYKKQGYYFIGFRKFEPKAEDTSVLELQIVEARIAKINIVGNKHTKTRVIREEMRSKEGDVFNLKTWEKDIYRVYNRGFFEDVTTNGPREVDNDPGQLEIDLVVKERHTGQLNVGFGYDQRQGLFGLLEVQDPNFQGRGQTVGISYQRTSDNRQSVELSFADPVIDRHHTGIALRLYDKLYYRFTNNFFGGGADPNADTNYDERHIGAEFSVSRPFGDVNKGTLTLRSEGITVNNVATDTTQSQGFIQQDGTILSLAAGFIQNNRDIDFNPSRGHYYKWSEEFGIDDITSVGGQTPDTSVLGTHNFVKSALDVRFYKSLQGPRIKPDDLKQVLALRVYYARIEGTIPFWEQLFLGGGDSLRGYQEDRFWGKNAFLSSLEYRIPIQKALTFVLFGDVGSAWGGYGQINNFNQHTSFRPYVGYGAGIRFQTPFGPFRIDLGFNEQGKARTHITVGHTF